MSAQVETLIESWPRSSAAWQRSRRSLAGGVSTGVRSAMKPHPLFFDHGRGSQLWDVDQHRYTDYVLGWGPLLLGHAHPRIDAAVRTQLARTQSYGACHELEYVVAEKVLSMVPGAERLLWTNSGTEANQIALRFARAVTGRERVVKFGGHFHGWHDSVLVSFRGPGVADSPTPIPGSRGQSSGSVSSTMIARWNDLESVRALLLEPAHDIAAVVAEPLLANSGVIPAEPGFLAGLREVCTATGTVLIFDEVITGFRLAPGGATQTTGVIPDLAVYAKAMAGGYPLAAVAGRAEILDEIERGVVHLGTYNGNPIVLAAANAVLDVLRETDPFDAMSSRAAQLVTAFTASLRRHDVPGSAHAVGPVLQVALGVRSLTTVRGYGDADWIRYDQLSVELLRRGQFVMPGGRWYISTEHTDSDIERTAYAFDAATAALRKQS